MITDMNNDAPPNWIAQLMHVVSKCITSEDEIQWRHWLHDDGTSWHIEVAPSIYVEAGEEYLRGYHVHVSPVLKLFDNVNIVADPEEISITGVYLKEHSVHLVIMLQPDDEYIDETDAPATEAEKELLN